MNPAHKALDANLLDMMATHVSKNIASTYTAGALDEMQTLSVKVSALEQLPAKIALVEQECAALRERLSMGDGGEALMQSREECAMYKGKCEELTKMVAMLSSRVDALESESEVEEPEEPEDEATGCEIDVVRGGDDRIRSLKVRYTK